MKKIGFIGFGVAAAILMAGCSDSRVTMPSDDVIIHEKATASIHPKEKYFLGQVEVKLGDRKYLAPVVANMKAKGIDISLLDKVPTQPLFLLKVNSNQSINEVMKALKSDDKVISVSKNYLVTTEALRVNDPLSKTQWALENYGQEAPRALAGRVGSDIGMAGVTATGSHEVVVAVIDTGIDYFHEDLAITEMVNGKKKVMPGSNIWVNPEEIPDNNINDDNNADSEYGISYVDDVHGYNFVSRNGDPMDDQGHGTHVSGVIGAL
jgi:subtilisin family serine protease